MKLTSDCTIEQYTSLVQETLILDPYSRRLRDLRKFANKNADPQYLSVFLTKLKLFELQQQQFRPNCRLSSAMYVLEKTIGRISTSRALIPTFLVMILAGVYACQRLPSWQYTDSFEGKDLSQLLEAYGMRIEESRNSSPDSTKNSTSQAHIHPDGDQFTQQLLQSLNNPSVRELLRQQIDTTPTTSDKDSQLPTTTDSKDGANVNEALQSSTEDL